MFKRLHFFICFAILLAVAGKPSFASQQWICVTTPHFEMYTTNSEKQAVRALQVFEQVRYFFLQNNKNKQAPEGRVRIIAFSSEKDYKPYRINAGAFAYYLPSRERDYIVMQDIEADHHEAAVHEYTHLIVKHNKMELPIWLNEGLADLYSSLEPRGQQAMVGRALKSRMATLAQQRWMDWNTLLAVDRSSPFYNESDKMSIFYAQSWALTHMLALSPPYRSHFSPFLLAVANGTSAPEAFQKIYEKTVPEVGKDVAAYVQQTSMQAAVFNLTLNQTDLNAQTFDLTPFQINLALADLLASSKGTASEAQRRLLVLSQQNPQNSEVETSLGYLNWQENNVPEAIKHFSLAVERGTKDTQMIYNLARLEQANGGTPQAVISLLQKVVALQPDKNEARIFLAQLEASQGHYGTALSTLAPIRNVQPEQAFQFFSVAAYVYANLHDLKAAKSSAERALQYAKTPVERKQVEHLAATLEEASHVMPSATNLETQAEAPTQESAPQPKTPGSTSFKQNQDLPSVLGKTKTFECFQGGFRLHLQVGAREMVFGMDHLQEILVRGVKDLQWSCGPLSARDVTVVYQPAGMAKLDGIVTELIF